MTVSRRQVAAGMAALMKRRAGANFTPDNAAALAPMFQGLGEGSWSYPHHTTLMPIIHPYADDSLHRHHPGACRSPASSAVGCGHSPGR